MARGSDRGLPAWRADAGNPVPTLLVVALSLLLLIALVVTWVSGHTGEWYRYIAGFQGVPPFVAALFCVRELLARRGWVVPAGRRYAAGLIVFVVGLLFWAVGEFALLGYGFFAEELPLYPSWLDVGPVGSIVCWAAVAFVTFEGFVGEDGVRFDVLKAVNEESRMLAIFFGANIAMLAVFHGANLSEVLTTDADPRSVGYALGAFYTTTDVFLMWMMVRLVHGHPGRAMVRGRAAMALMAAGLAILYVADLVFTLNYAVGQRQGEYLFSRYFGIVPDFFYVPFIACLSVAALWYPLEPPVFASDGR